MKKNFQGKILKKFANLQFAIILLFVISVLISIGTVIEQDQSLLFYKENYPETSPLFGFLDWKFILFFNFNQLYTSWWFVGILVLFVSSLLACTFTTQIPSLKKFKLWKFLTKRSQFNNLLVTNFGKVKFSNALVYKCNQKRYHIFRQNKKNYAYSGLLGRIAPVVVHGSIVILLWGSTVGAFSGYKAQEMVTRGELFHVQNLLDTGKNSYITQQMSCRINDFWVTYTSDIKTDQFYSDISVLDSKGFELKRKIIFVNEPLNYKNLTFYQTDWDIVGIKLKTSQNKLIQLPVKKVSKSGRKFWFGSIILGEDKFTFVLNDLQGRIFIYNSAGDFVAETLTGREVLIPNKNTFQFVDVIASTGIQIKADAGIFTIYLSFFLLMVSIFASFMTYSQIWLTEHKNKLLVGGNSNRAVLFFQEEFRRTLTQISR